MTHVRARLLPPRRAVGAVGAALVLLSASGCVASEASDASPREELATAAPASGAPATVSPSVTDEETCTAFGDVLTITHNIQTAVHQGRMEEQEQRGWYRLATRVLDRVPSAEEGAVAEALEALKQTAPAIPPGEVGTAGIGTDAWNTAELTAACEAAGFELVAEGFVGG